MMAKNQVTKGSKGTKWKVTKGSKGEYIPITKKSKSGRSKKIYTFVTAERMPAGECAGRIVTGHHYCFIDTIVVAAVLDALNGSGTATCEDLVDA